MSRRSRQRKKDLALAEEEKCRGLKAIVLCPFCLDEHGEHPVMTDELEPKLEGRIVFVCSICRHCYCVTRAYNKIFSCGCMRCQEIRNPLGAEEMRKWEASEKAKISPEGQAQLEELRIRLSKDFFDKPAGPEKKKEGETFSSPEGEEQRNRLDKNFFGENFKKFCEEEKKREEKRKKQ